jgi:peptidoglycan hydrolase-like protein with peptidoglycan-binding domain
MTTTLRPGESGELVKRLQGALVGYGYLDAEGADGKFGARTKTAVMSFQAKRSLPTTGVADPQTIAAMDLDPDTLKDLIEIDGAHDGGAETHLVLVEKLGPGWFRFRWNRDVQEDEIRSLLFGDETPTVQIAKEASGTILVSGIYSAVVRPELQSQLVNAPEGKPPTTDRPSSDGEAPAIDVEMDENAVVEWVHRALDGAHYIADTAEVVEAFKPIVEGLSAEAGVSVAAVVGEIAGTIVVLWAVVHAFGTGTRLQEQEGFCYGVMWETFDMPNGDKAFLPWAPDTAEELREAFYDGVGQGREKAKDIKVHNGIMIAVGYYMAKGSDKEWSQRYAINDLWRKVRETDIANKTLTWPKPEDMQ